MNIGTRLFTYFKGRQVGTDCAGNRYFVERRSRGDRIRLRCWVIYPGLPEASSVPAEWHSWLHYTTDNPLPETPRYAWQKPHLSNATGTVTAYRPAGHDYSGGRTAAADGDYESSTPGDRRNLPGCATELSERRP